MKRRYFLMAIVASVALLAGCNEDSASEKLAKQQLDAIADAEKKKEEGKKAILNNTVNPFSFDKKTSAEK